MAGEEALPNTGRSAASGAAGSDETWGGALWKGALVLVLAFLGFVAVPDRLFSYLALHVGPRLRDLLVLLEVVVAFVLLTWLFVRLQTRRTRT
jgi:hypothetical protein